MLPQGVGIPARPAPDLLQGYRLWNCWRQRSAGLQLAVVRLRSRGGSCVGVNPRPGARDCQKESAMPDPPIPDPQATLRRMLGDLYSPEEKRRMNGHADELDPKHPPLGGRWKGSKAEMVLKVAAG